MADPLVPSGFDHRTKRLIASGLMLVLTMAGITQYLVPAVQTYLDPGRVERAVADLVGIPHEATAAPEQFVSLTGGHPLPTIPLDEALRHDPFAVPRALDPEPERTPGEETAQQPFVSEADRLRRAQEARRAALQQEAVVLVVRGERGPAALFRGRMVHEGDVIDGVRVLKIEPSGLLVELVDPLPADTAAPPPDGPASDEQRL